MVAQILVIGEQQKNPLLCDTLSRAFKYEVCVAPNDTVALRIIKEQSAAGLCCAIVDMAAMGDSGLVAIQALHHAHPKLPVLAIVAYGDARQPEHAIAAGALDFLVKPIAVERLRQSLKVLVRLKQMGDYTAWLERRVSGHVDFHDLVGEHTAIAEAQQLGKMATTSKIPVWIESPPGCETDLLARAIHCGGPRAGKPFVELACHLLPQASARDALFGNESGVQGYVMGKLQEADGGTLLLEQPETLPDAIKHDLLLFLETGRLPAGPNTPSRSPDVRIMCAGRSGSDPLAAISPASRRLRERLRGVVLALPPLAQRGQDIGAWVAHFIAIASASEAKFIRGLTPQAQAWVEAQPWPGNIQQLSQVVRRAVAQAQGEWLDVQDFAAQGRASGNAAFTSAEYPQLVDSNGRVKTLKSVQDEAIRYALNYCGGCMTRAAKTLGIGRSTLYRKLGEGQRRAPKAHISRANQTTRPIMTVSSTERS
jgi:two-component system response regulator AtoC